MRLFLTLMFLLTLAAPSLAQTVLPTKWEMRFYSGGAAPISTHSLLVADVTCGIDPATAMPSWSARWEQAGMGICQWISPASGVLQSRPVGVTYTVALVAINNDTDGPSPESNRVGFRLPAVAPAPTGLVLRSGGS